MGLFWIPDCHHPYYLLLCLGAGSAIPRGPRIHYWATHTTNCSQAATLWRAIKDATFSISILATTIFHKWLCMPGSHCSHHVHVPNVLIIPFQQVNGVCFIWPHLTSLNIQLLPDYRLPRSPAPKWAQSLQSRDYTTLSVKTFGEGRRCFLKLTYKFRIVRNLDIWLPALAGKCIPEEKNIKQITKLIVPTTSSQAYYLRYICEVKSWTMRMLESPDSKGHAQSSTHASM